MIDTSFIPKELHMHNYTLRMTITIENDGIGGHIVTKKADVINNPTKFTFAPKKVTAIV